MVRMIIELYDGFQCVVIEEGEISEWFQIKTEVKQGCVMSDFLFPLTTDYVMREEVNDRKTGIG